MKHLRKLILIYQLCFGRGMMVILVFPMKTKDIFSKFGNESHEESLMAFIKYFGANGNSGLPSSHWIKCEFAPYFGEWHEWKWHIKFVWNLNIQCMVPHNAFFLPLQLYKHKYRVNFCMNKDKPVILSPCDLGIIFYSQHDLVYSDTDLKSFKRTPTPVGL